MQIAGITKLTLLDYPGKLACTVFTPGCQLRCPFCHNAQLALANPNEPTDFSTDEAISYLKKRNNVIEGVCISGGEPLMQDGIVDFIKDVKSLGYLVKLDTNGGFPEKLAMLLDLRLIDYVAMDIKNCLSRYAETCGHESIGLSQFRKSISLIQNSSIAYEFRSTIVRELHNKENILQFNAWGIGTSKLFLQSFQNSSNVMRSGLHGYSAIEMEALRQSILPIIPNTSVRITGN